MSLSEDGLRSVTRVERDAQQHMKREHGNSHERTEALRGKVEVEQMSMKQESTSLIRALQDAKVCMDLEGWM